MSEKMMTDEERNELGRKLSEFFAKTHPIEDGAGDVREAYLVVGFRETDQSLRTFLSAALDDRDTVGMDRVQEAENTVDKIVAVSEVSAAAGAVVAMRDKVSKMADEAGSRALTVHGALNIAHQLADGDREKLRQGLAEVEREYNQVKAAGTG